MTARIFYGTVQEDGNYTVLARMCSLDGTGDEYIPGEGKVLKQADVSSIGCKVYALGTDKNSLTGTEVTPSPSVSISSSIFDTLRTTGWPLVPPGDLHGYNFRHDLSGTYAPAPEEWYLIEYTFNLASGGVAYLKEKVKTVPTRGS